MCIPSPSPLKEQPTPTQSVADYLQLGVGDIQNRQAGQIGRLALTSGGAAALAKSTAQSVLQVGGEPSGNTTSGDPGGTIGMPTSKYAGATGGTLPRYQP